MNQEPNLSTKFRAALRSEVPRWRAEGLISDESAARLASLYQLDSLKGESSNLLLTVIFTVGALLVGGGVISFVAANWERISDPVRLILLFVVLVGLEVGGFLLWQVGDWRRLGRGLILAGCLVFGANIGLTAQILHISGEWYGAFGAWALGSLGMAWAIRSRSIGLLVIVTSMTWFFGFDNDYQRVGVLFPLGLGAALLPLCWVIRSRLLYAATLIGIVIAACFLAGTRGDASQLLLTMSAAGLAMWMIGEVHLVSLPRRELSIVARGLGLILLALSAHISSIRFVWETSNKTGVPTIWAIVFMIITAIGAIIVYRNKSHTRRFALGGVLTAGALLCGGALAAIYTNAEQSIFFVLANNVAALTLGAVAIRISLADESRALFWLGSVYIMVLVFARFLEYETSLLLKSVAFVACGVAVIVAGVRYEKYLKERSREAALEPAGEVQT
jgi:uncharacterized membrane protein